jgi:hypothetical protein
MVYSFARIGAAHGMAVEDVYTQNCRLWVRLREKGGKRHAMPGHHNLDEYLVAYLDGAALRGDPKGPLFRTIGRGTGKLTRTVLPQANTYAMIRRRAAAAGIGTKLGNHSFRATGITASRMAARLNRPRRWRTTLRPGRRSSIVRSHLFRRPAQGRDAGGVRLAPTRGRSRGTRAGRSRRPSQGLSRPLLGSFGRVLKRPKTTQSLGPRPSPL